MCANAVKFHKRKSNPKHTVYWICLCSRPEDNGVLSGWLSEFRNLVKNNKIESLQCFALFWNSCSYLLNIRKWYHCPEFFGLLYVVLIHFYLIKNRNSVENVPWVCSGVPHCKLEKLGVFHYVTSMWLRVFTFISSPFCLLCLVFFHWNM